MPIFTVPVDDSDLLLEHGTPGQPNYPHGKGGVVRLGRPNLHGKVIIRQTGARSVPVSPALTARLTEIAESNLTPERRSRLMEETVNRMSPALMSAAEALVRRGREGQAEFKAVTSQLAGHFGFKTSDSMRKAEAGTLYTDENGYVLMGPIKTVGRTAVKAAADYYGDTAQVKDVLRATIAVQSADDLARVLGELTATGVDIVGDSLKDNISKPLGAGYRDINVLIRLPGSGMLAEIQIITKPMLQAKNGDGHKLYAAHRALDPSSAQAQSLMRQMQALYSAAWAKTNASKQAVDRVTETVTQIRNRAH